MNQSSERKSFKIGLSVFSWAALLQWSKVGINALVFIALSRILSLEEIGIFAIAQSPVILFQTIVFNTLPEFIIQEERLGKRRLSSIFWVSTALGVAITLVTAAASKYIGISSGQHTSSTYMLALSVCPLIYSVSAVFDGLLQRKLDTKLLAIRTLVSSSVSGAISILLAVNGGGVWSFVCFSILNAFIGGTISILSCEWRPVFAFYPRYINSRWRKLISLAGRHLLSGATIPILNYAVGFNLGSSYAGALQIAFRIHNLVDSLAMAPYRFVVMPFFARAHRTTKGNAGSQIEKAVMLGGMIATPAYISAIVILPAILPLLLGETNGNASARIAQLICISGLIAAPTNILKQVLIAHGHATVVFWRSLLMFIITIIPTAIATQFSLNAVGLSYGLLGGFVSFVISLMVTRAYIRINSLEVISDWAGQIAVSSVIFCSLFVYTLPVGELARVLLLFALIFILHFCAMLIFQQKKISIIKEALNSSSIAS